MVPNVAGSNPVDRPSFGPSQQNPIHYNLGSIVQDGDTMAKKSAAKKSSPRNTTEIRGMLVLAGAIVLLLSLISFATGADSKNWLGLMGHTIGWTFHALFGIGSYIICGYIAWIGWRLLFTKPINNPSLKAVYIGILVASFCILLSLVEDRYPEAGSFLGNLFYGNLWQKKLRYHIGGAPFYYLYKDLPALNVHRIFNTTGIAIIFSSTLLASILFLAKKSPAHLLSQIWTFLTQIKEWSPEFRQPELQTEPAIKEEPTTEPAAPPSGESDFIRFVKLRIPGSGAPTAGTAGTSDGSATSQEVLRIQPETNLKERPSLSRKEQADTTEVEPQEEPPAKPKKVKEAPEKPAAEAPTPQKKREAAIAAQKVYNGDFSGYQMPPLALLTTPKKVDQSNLKKDLRRQAEVLEETLSSFGIEAKVGQINCGPTITSFEVHPAIGVKVQKIKTLENDIALNMEAKSIRIIAPIPGKAAVGVEVPNAQPQEVGFKDMMSAYQQEPRKFHIPILLGKAVNGDYVMADLTKMPHCIIAGATGSGKSVCINTIVMSILLNARPDEIKLVMVDPKKVELTPYTKLPHMLAPVITEPQGACAALQWLVKEMESRYDILKLIGVRNIEGFNTRTVNKEFESTLDREIPPKMPYIVGIIDELADLMMVASNDIETPIARIAQMARAVGIHLILATQRPSREVITGLIKANFPTRISFKVASRVNSQIVLDETGAETLLGNGDMLFLPPGSSHLVRAQGAFIRDDDINAVVKQICDQAPPNYVIESFDRIGHISVSSDDGGGEPSGDSMYHQALDIVTSTGNASTTFLQRKLKIGYARAASLIDQLETNGVVGPADGSKARKVLQGRGKSKDNIASADLFDSLEDDDE